MAAPRGRRESSARSATTSSRGTSTRETRRSSPASSGCRRRTRSRSGPTACGGGGTGRSSRASRRRTPSPPCARRSSTPCGSSCAATFPSARASPAGSTRRRSRSPSPHHGPRAPEDRHRVLRATRLRRAPVSRSAVVERTGAERALGLVRRRRARRRPAGDRPGAGRAVRLDVDLRRLVRHARGEASAGLTVMLDGQGGDEILAGYRASFGYRLSDLLRAGRLGEATQELRAFARCTGRAGPRSRSRRRTCPSARGSPRAAGCAAPSTLVAPDLRARRPPTQRTASPFPDRLRRQLHRPAHRPRPARAAALRGPQLDGALARGARAVPRPPARRARVLARRRRADPRAARRSRCSAARSPTCCRRRSRARRDKLGFVTPEARFLRGALGDLAADVFASQSFRERGFVDAWPRRPPARATSARRRRGRHGALARAQPRAVGARFLDA